MSWTCSVRCSLNAQVATWMLRLSSPISAWLFCTIWNHYPTLNLSKCSSSPDSSRKALSESLPTLPIPHDDGLDSSHLLQHTPSSQNDRLLSLLMETCSRLFPSYPQGECLLSFRERHLILEKFLLIIVKGGGTERVLPSRSIFNIPYVKLL